MLEAAALGADERERLTSLVRDCRFFDRDEAPPPARRGADQREYVLTVDWEETGCRTLRLRDPVAPDLAALLDFVREKQRQSRAPR